MVGKDVKYVFTQLESFGNRLLDSAAALAEVHNKPQYVLAPPAQLSAEDQDCFDTQSFVIPLASAADIAAILFLLYL